MNAGSLPASPPSGSTVTTWAYEPATGLLSAKRYADGKGPDYAYDEAGRLMTRWWARQGSAGQRFASHYSWTDLGQLSGIAYTDGITQDVSISYDCLGRITEQGNGVAISAFTYSPTTLLLNGETLTYDFDRDGTPELVRQLDRSQDTYLRSAGYQLRNGSTVEAEASYGYDSAGRIGSVSGGSLGTFNYSYEPASNLLAGVSGPAHTVTKTWEPNRDVLSLKENKVGTTVVSAYGYSVNGIGQRTASTQYGTAFASSRQIGWSYDALGQVTAADSSENAHDRVYEYDAIGNRRKSANSLTLPSQPNYASNVLNQYTAVDAVVPSYDEDGNATSYPLPASPSSSSTLTWDGENRLASTTMNGAVTSYVYDLRLRRIAVTAGGITKVTVYDGWNPIADYLSGTLQGAGGVGGLLALSTGSQTYDPTYDGNGNVSEYLDGSGAIAAHFEYTPFGQTTVDTDSSGMFDIRFSTKRRDVETGLYYYGYRYYDPVSGRWPSRDPIDENGGVNLYSFILNNALSKIDYLGLCDCTGGAAKVKDDAGMECCPETMGTVELRIDDGLIGHAWLATDGGSFARGQYPFPRGSSTPAEYLRGPSPRAGATKDDSKRAWDRKKTYKACPGSTEKLKNSLNSHDKDDFDLSNMGARNCAGWACQRLEDAGFTPPNSPTTPKLKPSWIK